MRSKCPSTAGGRGKSPNRLHRPAWSVVADMCRNVLSAPAIEDAPSGSADNWDAAHELRMIAASMLDGPLYVPGLWPVTIDRIMLQLDARA